MVKNFLKSSTSQIFFMLFLFQLVLRDNDLISLPKEIGELSRLKELHIQSNRLTVLPPELGTKITLNSLFLPCLNCRQIKFLVFIRLPMLQRVGRSVGSFGRLLPKCKIPNPYSDCSVVVCLPHCVLWPNGAR